MVPGAYSTFVKEAVFMVRLHCECFPCRLTSLQEPFSCVPSSPDQSDGSPAGLRLRDAWRGREDAESRAELRPRRRGRRSGGA